MSSFWDRFKFGFHTGVKAKAGHWTNKGGEKAVLKNTKKYAKQEKKSARKAEKQAR